MIDLINKKKLELLGEAPKGEDAKKKKAKAAPVKEEKKEEKKAAEGGENTATASTGKSILDLVGRDLKSTQNSEELLAKHK